MNKTTLIILHGWGHDASHWTYFVEHIAGDMPTVVLEFPGFGQRPLVSQEWGVPEYAEWAEQEIAKIAGDKIILGHSFGGRVASVIASNRPSWLKAIILYGAPCLYRPSHKTTLVIARNKFLKKMGLGKLVSATNAELADADRNNLGKIFRKVVPFDQTALLPLITVPTLLVWGSVDTAVPLRIAEEMKALIAHSDLVIIDHAGHNAHQEKPHLFYGIIKKFIKTF